MLFLNPVQCKTGLSFNQQYDNGNKDIWLYILCIDYSKYITSKVKKIRNRSVLRVKKQLLNNVPPSM